jgi:hypothetical protein
VRTEDIGNLDFIERGHRGSRPFLEMPAPILVALKGWVIGGSFERALLCDLRVAGESAKMRLPELMHGVIPDSGGTARLFQIAGHGLAADLALTGRVLDAQEALRHGVVSRVVPDEQLDAVCLEMAHQIAKLSPFAVRVFRRTLARLANPAVAASMQEEAIGQTLVQASEDYAEMKAARAAKREPKYGTVSPPRSPAPARLRRVSAHARRTVASASGPSHARKISASAHDCMPLHLIGRLEQGHQAREHARRGEKRENDARTRPHDREGEHAPVELAGERKGKDRHHPGGGGFDERGAPARREQQERRLRRRAAGFGLLALRDRLRFLEPGLGRQVVESLAGAEDVPVVEDDVLETHVVVEPELCVSACAPPAPELGPGLAAAREVLTAMQSASVVENPAPSQQHSRPGAAFAKKRRARRAGQVRPGRARGRRGSRWHSRSAPPRRLVACARTDTRRCRPRRASRSAGTRGR